MGSQPNWDHDTLEIVTIKKRQDAIGREFWKQSEEARRKVKSWPLWKQHVKVSER